MKEVDHLPRNKLRLVIGWLTDHWGVRLHLHNMGLCNIGDGRWCGSVREPSEYLLYLCPKYTNLRQRIRDTPFLNPEEIQARSVGKVSRLVKDINIDQNNWGERRMGKAQWAHNQCLSRHVPVQRPPAPIVLDTTTTATTTPTTTITIIRIHCQTSDDNFRGF